MEINITLMKYKIELRELNLFLSQKYTDIPCRCITKKQFNIQQKERRKRKRQLIKLIKYI